MTRAILEHRKSIGWDQMTKYNNRWLFLSLSPPPPSLVQVFFRAQPSLSLLRLLASSSTLFSPATSSCRSPAGCVGASVCPVGEIRQKGCRSRGHLSQSDGAAEKYVTRENQFQRRLAPTGLAVKAIVSVPRQEGDGEWRTSFLLRRAREEDLERGHRAIYAILSSVRISCGCGLGAKRCFMRRFAAFRQCDRTARAKLCPPTNSLVDS